MEDKKGRLFMGTQRIKVKTCKCNFKFPKPLRQEDNGGRSYVMFGTDIFLLEFFCAFCRSVIVNNGKYIVEVIRYHATARWSLMREDPHKDMVRELEYGYGLFARQYKRLLKLTV